MVSDLLSENELQMASVLNESMVMKWISPDIFRTNFDGAGPKIGGADPRDLPKNRRWSMEEVMELVEPFSHLSHEEYPSIATTGETLAVHEKVADGE